MVISWALLRLPEAPNLGQALGLVAFEVHVHAIGRVDAVAPALQKLDHSRRGRVDADPVLETGPAKHAGIAAEKDVTPFWM